MADQSACIHFARRAACLQRLATALVVYADLAVTVWADGPAPRLAVRNITVPIMSETIAACPSGGGLAYTWSWGKRIGDASNPDQAAEAIAYVLGAAGAPAGR